MRVDHRAAPDICADVDVGGCHDGDACAEKCATTDSRAAGNDANAARGERLLGGPEIVLVAEMGVVRMRFDEATKAKTI